MDFTFSCEKLVQGTRNHKLTANKHFFIFHCQSNKVFNNRVLRVEVLVKFFR